MSLRKLCVHLLTLASLVNVTYESCFVELRSWGYEDESKTGFVRVNHTVVFQYSGNDMLAMEKHRGINTNLLRISDCTAYDQRTFDTFAYKTEEHSQDLTNYVESLAHGSILVGVSCDSAAYLTQRAKATMSAIGVDLTEFKNRGKLTFAAIIGRPRSTVFRIGDRGGDNKRGKNLYMYVTANDTDITGPCQPGQFICTNGQCVQLSDRCNGQGDCDDGSDEAMCTHCRQTATRCHGDRCMLSKYGGCDPYFKCINDPRSCSCNTNQFNCSSGECIPEQYRCNGWGDCYDGSDEVNCTSCPGLPSNCTGQRCPRGYSKASKPFVDYRCDYLTCLSDDADTRERCSCDLGMFKCSDGECVTLSQRCDKIRDCRDGSDERNCECTNEDDLQCPGESVCLPSNYRCDGFRDCIDGSDEVGCAKCAAQDVLMLCGEGRCIARQAYRCDGKNDCADGSDESNCTSCNHGELFRCLGDGMCMHGRCDGFADCKDWSDERDCVCGDRFSCKLGGCRPLGDRCNGMVDCLDNSDEADCPFCQRGSFLCGLSKCVKDTARCDGVNNCGDNRDEVNCNECSGGAFLCSNRRCILRELECNGLDDCGDNSDEHCGRQTVVFVLSSLFGLSIGIIVIVVVSVTLVRKRRTKRSIAVENTEALIELKKKTGSYDYCEKQLSGIYDEIVDPDETYTGLQHETARSGEHASDYAHLPNNTKAETISNRASGNVRGTDAATEYLQLINDPYVDVLPDDDVSEYLNTADYS